MINFFRKIVTGKAFKWIWTAHLSFGKVIQAEHYRGFSQVFPSSSVWSSKYFKYMFGKPKENSQEGVNSSRYQLKQLLCFEITLGVWLFHSMVNLRLYLLLCALHNSISDRKCLRCSHVEKGFSLTQKIEFRFILQMSFDHQLFCLVCVWEEINHQWRWSLSKLCFLFYAFFFPLNTCITKLKNLKFYQHDS